MGGFVLFQMKRRSRRETVVLKAKDELKIENRYGPAVSLTGEAFEKRKAELEARERGNYGKYGRRGWSIR